MKRSLSWMTLPDCNAKTIGSRIVEGFWKICLDDFLTILAGEEVVSLFTNYEVIKPLPRYDCIVDGVVMAVFGDNLLSPLKVLNCKLVCRWILSQSFIISLSNLHAQLERQSDQLWYLCCLSRSWV